MTHLSVASMIFLYLLMQKVGWFDFLVVCKYLCLRNIYSYGELKQMNIENKEQYSEILQRLIEFYLSFESVLQEGDMTDEVRNFILEDLNGNYETLQDLTEDINYIIFPKRRFCTKRNFFSEKMIASLN